MNWQLFFLCITAFSVGSSFPNNYWAFVDDGEIIEVSQRINSNLSLLSKGHLLNWLADPQLGRFRPFYWLYHYVVYVFFGINHFGHGIIQLLLLFTTVLCAYFTAKIITNNKNAGFIAGLIFVLSTLSQENWYRLGPQEAPMTFFMALSVICILRFINSFFQNGNREFAIKKLKFFLTFNFASFFKNVEKKNLFLFILSVIFIIPAYFTKENSISFLTFPFVIFIWSCLINTKESRSLRTCLIVYLILNIALALTVRIFAMRSYVNGSYASDYIVTIPNILSNLKYYFFTIWITYEPLILLTVFYLLIDLACFIVNKKINSNFIITIAVGATSLSFFVVQLPWQFAITRYLFPTLYFFSIFLGVLISNLINLFRSPKSELFMKELGLGKNGNIPIFAVWFLLSVTLMYNVLMMSQYISRMNSLTNDFNKPLITSLANGVRENGTIFLDTPVGTALELKQEIGLHLRLFFDRGDVSVEYLDSNSQYTEGDMLLRAGEFKQASTDKTFKNFVLSDPEEIDIHLENKLYYPPMQLLKDYIPQWLFALKEHPGTHFVPILAHSEDNYFWKIYKFNLSR